MRPAVRQGFTCLFFITPARARSSRRRRERRGEAPEGTMWLIIIYLMFMIVGDVADYLIGIFVERVWPAASLPIFLGLYFLFLWPPPRRATGRENRGRGKSAGSPGWRPYGLPSPRSGRCRRADPRTCRVGGMSPRTGQPLPVRRRPPPKPSSLPRLPKARLTCPTVCELRQQSFRPSRPLSAVPLWKGRNASSSSGLRDPRSSLFYCDPRRLAFLGRHRLLSTDLPR